MKQNVLQENKLEESSNSNQELLEEFSKFKLSMKERGVWHPDKDKELLEEFYKFKLLMKKSGVWHGDKQVLENNSNSSLEKGATESKELIKLFEVMPKAQLEMPVAKEDSINPHYQSNYAKLKSLIKASRPSLCKYGLSVIQRTLTLPNGDLFFYTRLCHSSGQWIESNMQVKPIKSDIQSLGSYISYIKRYMYSSITGVVSGDGDDDGEAAMNPPSSLGSTAKKESKISRAQLQVLSQELESHPEIVEGILKRFNIKKLSDLPSKVYTGCIERVREIKRAKES